MVGLQLWGWGTVPALSVPRPTFLGPAEAGPAKRVLTGQIVGLAKSSDWPNRRTGQIVGLAKSSDWPNRHLKVQFYHSILFTSFQYAFSPF
jgi:hypothetical protein